MLKYAAILLFVPVLILSQPMRDRDRIGKDERINKITEKMAEELSLSDEQKTKIKGVNSDFAVQFDEARDKCEGDREKMRETVKALNDDREIKYKVILTEEQWKLYNKTKGEFLEKRGNRKRDRMHR